jgi:predicted O-methyltransferase YrrM
MTNVASHVVISKALNIGGWMSTGELLWLATQARKFRTIVEFGSLHGRSTRALADNICEDGKIWAVDPWGNDYIAEDGTNVKINTYVYPYFLNNLVDHIEADRVIPVRGFSYSFSLPHTVDMVFIDGDHRYETVVRDIKKALELVRPGGIISGHDYDHPGWPGVKKAVDEFFGEVELKESIWHTVKS